MEVRGQFTGHYLSALAMAYNYTGALCRNLHAAAAWWCSCHHHQRREAPCIERWARCRMVIDTPPLPLYVRLCMRSWRVGLAAMHVLKLLVAATQVMRPSCGAWRLWFRSCTKCKMPSGQVSAHAPPYTIHPSADVVWCLGEDAVSRNPQRPIRCSSCWKYYPPAEQHRGWQSWRVHTHK